MLDKIDIGVYKEYIQKYNALLQNGQWNDQYQLEITMLKPNKKIPIPHELVKSFSFQYQGQQVQYSAIGNQALPYFDEVEFTNLDIVLYNLSAYTTSDQTSVSFLDFLIYKRAKRNPFKITDFKQHLGYNLQDYFVLDENGKPILPKDGSSLLPSEYNFKITAYSLDGYWTKRELFSGIFLLDGNITIDYSSDGGSIQELSVTFKKFEDIETTGDIIEVIPNPNPLTAWETIKEIF